MSVSASLTRTSPGQCLELQKDIPHVLQLLIFHKDTPGGHHGHGQSDSCSGFTTTKRLKQTKQAKTRDKGGGNQLPASQSYRLRRPAVLQRMPLCSAIHGKAPDALAAQGCSTGSSSACAHQTAVRRTDVQERLCIWYRHVTHHEPRPSVRKWRGACSKSALLSRPCQRQQSQACCTVSNTRNSDTKQLYNLNSEFAL